MLTGLVVPALSSCVLFHSQVDADAFDALLECVTEGTYDKCETVPAGDDAGFLIQPIGGIAVETTGPARCDVCSRLVYESRPDPWVGSKRSSKAHGSSQLGSGGFRTFTSR